MSSNGSVRCSTCRSSSCCRRTASRRIAQRLSAFFPEPATRPSWSGRSEGCPLDLLSAYGAGVQLHVEDLADHLAGRKRRVDVKARWDELHTAYLGLVNLSRLHQVAAESTSRASSRSNPSPITWSRSHQGRTVM